MADKMAGRAYLGSGSSASTGDTAVMETLLRTLRRCKLFTSVPVPELRTILTLGQEQYVAKRATVFRQGDRTHGIYVVLQGKFKLFLTGPSGRGIILTLVEPGEPFGYIAAMAGTARAYTAQATEDSRVLVWAAETFEEILRRYPRMTRNILRLTARQLQAEWSRLHDLAADPVARRLARTVLRLARASGQHRRPVLAMMQQDLAELLGTTPSTLSRILGRWEARGMVTAGRERVVIAHPEGLAKIAESDEPIGRAGLRRAKSVPPKWQGRESKRTKS
jgi:CRP-like cAMP-binding protein